MNLIGNLIWIVICGLAASIGWCIAGIICCITILGIPFGKQCFKMAELQLAPFGRKVVKSRVTTLGLFGNIIWIIFLGWEIALINLVATVVFVFTIIGIPFAFQSFKLATLALMPFNKEII